MKPVSATTVCGNEQLERVIEPLASFICASDQPQAALTAAIAVLLREVETTNRVAGTIFRTFSLN